MKSKKRIINNGIFITLGYVLIFIANNFKLIVKNVLGKSLDSGIEFINISILLSIIILALVIIFRKYLFKSKINLLMICCTVLVYNFE